MRRSGLSYNIVGGFSFYERMEVRDIIAYLKLAMNPHDSIALQRVINTPARGIGKMTLDEIEVRARELGVSYWEAITDLLADERRLSPRAGAALANFQKIVKGLSAKAESVMVGASDSQREDGESEEGSEGFESAGTSPTVRQGSDIQTVESTSPVSDLVKAAILDTGYENALKAENNEEAEARLENLQELVNAAVDYDEQGPEGLRDFIDHSALVADTDQYKSDVPVTLMTAHSAKGLEFPLVFIVGLEDGLFPHSRSLSDASDIEEERRLAYVAMTRAEKYLYVTHAVKRRVYGEELASEPSQFLNEMPIDLIEDISRGRSWLSFARESMSVEQAAGSLQYEFEESSGSGPAEISESGNSGRLSARRPGTKFPGKTYDSVESIEEFFRKRAAKMGGHGTSSRKVEAISPDSPRGTAANKGGSPNPQSTRPGIKADGDVRAPVNNDILPGSYVRHAKYGRGLVLRREGSGDQTKFTVSFPGYGQKKLIEKYANLEKG
jgi:DNA helicase-2/ATP-dependent DNA helicase PcrA